MPEQHDVFQSLRSAVAEDGHPELRMFINRNGLRLCIYKWGNGASQETSSNPGLPKGAVLLVHGLASHARFEYLNHVYQDEMDALWHRKLNRRDSQVANTVRRSSFSVIPRRNSKAKQDLTVQRKHNSIDILRKSEENDALSLLSTAPEQQPGLDESKDAAEHTFSLEDIPLKDLPGVSDLYFTPTRSYLVPRSQQPKKKAPVSEVCRDRPIGLSEGEVPTITKNEYCLSYENSWVDRWKRNHFLVFALDLQSHGLSDGWRGQRCIVNDFDDFALDVLDVIREIRCDIPTSLPLFAVGISMGGAILTRALELGSISRVLPQDTLRGAIILAPALSLHELKKKLLNAIALPFAKFLSTVLPSGKLVSIQKNEKYPHILQYCQLDPLVYSDRIPIRLAVEMLNTIEVIHNSVGQVTPEISVLFCHSVFDTMCNLDGTVQIYSLLQVEDKQLWFIHAMWHFLTIEPGSKDLLSHILRWCNARLHCSGKKISHANVNTDPST